MAHAHPSPDGSLYLPVNQSPQSFQTFYSSTSAGCSSVKALTTQRPYDGISPHNRRLQLRNAGFRAAVFPPRRLSPFLAGTKPLSPSERPITDENLPKTTEKRVLYGEDLPPSSGSILQEISNSARRKANPSKVGVGQIFEDSTATKGTCESTTISWVQEANGNSPSPRSDPPYKMLKLREGSLNERTPSPLNSPMIKQINSRRRSRISPRSTSFEATKYIEHLESELGSLHTKIDALTSPTAAKSQTSKLRALTAQIRTFRNELSGWESKFDDRVADAIYQRSVIDADLKMQIRRFEDEAEMKDIKITELERELENAAIKIKNSESLASTNLELERKNNFLTELLAISPTKFESQSAVTSPVKLVFNQRPPRPRSMLPSIPASASDVRRASTSTFDMVSWCPRNFARTFSIAESPEESVFSPTDEGVTRSSQTAKHSRHSKSNESGSGASFSLTSAPSSSSSRPTSLISTSSSGTSFGFPTGSLDESKLVNRQRRMRRFPSGTCSLKPLILPTATVGPLLPASAPLYWTGQIPTRDVSDVLYDPSVSSASKNELPSPITTPTQPRRRSVTAARKNSLDIVEGKPICTSVTQVSETSSEMLVDRTPGAIIQTDEYEDQPSTVQSPNLKRRSLQVELERVKEVLDTKSDTTPVPPNVRGESDRRRSLGTDRVIGNIDGVDSNRSTKNAPNSPVGSTQHSSSHLITTPRQSGMSPLPTSSQGKETYISTSTFETKFGIFTKLADLITSMKQDPVALARRILRNAWIFGSSKFGGICWWLLGLLFGSYRWKKKQTTDLQTDEEDLTGNVGWSHYSSGTHQAGRTEQYPDDVYDSPRQVYLPSTRCDPEGVGEAFHSPGLSTDATRNHTMIARESPLRCKDCVEPTSRRTVRLWFKLSLAIVLAIGVAIKEGPGTLLIDTPLESSRLVYESRSRTAVQDSDKSSSQHIVGVGKPSVLDGCSEKNNNNLGKRRCDH